MTTGETASVVVVMLIFLASMLRLAAYIYAERRKPRCCDCGKPADHDAGRHLLPVPDWEKGGHAYVCNHCEPGLRGFGG